MKVLTVAQMNAVDRATVERGIPDIILMENAAHRVVEYVAERLAPVSKQRIVVVCGKGNNGGDGLAIARILHTRFRLELLEVVLAGDPHEQQLKMLTAAGLEAQRDFSAKSRTATLVIDAVLGTGLNGSCSRPRARCDPRDQHAVSVRERSRSRYSVGLSGR